jgi:hypothetical protein
MLTSSTSRPTQSRTNPRLRKWLRITEAGDSAEERRRETLLFVSTSNPPIHSTKVFRCRHPTSIVHNNQLISESRMVDDFVPRSGQRSSQPTHIFPGGVGRHRQFRFVIEFGADPVVVDHVTAMSVEEREEPPEVGRQATWLASDQHEVPSPVDVPGLVEIVGKRDLLAASIA